MSKVGVISFQGDFEKHLKRVRNLGAEAVSVRDPALIGAIDALILPGGESTTIGMLLERFGFLTPIRDAISAGLPVLATCAGTILLADEIIGSNQVRIGGLNVAVRRNAYGRQIESFEAVLDVLDESWSGWRPDPVRGVFIRAPILERVSENVDILMKFEGFPVAVRQGNVLAITFHPELTPDTRIHAYFLSQVAGI